MNIALVIQHLYPTAKPLVDFWVRDDSDGNGPYIAAWNLPDPQPTQAELEAAWAAYEANRKATEYRELRKAEYPTTGDQLDAIWKLLEPAAGTEAAVIKEQILAVKAKYPKPTA